ncbi:MAG: primosomal protein N' [Rhodobacteraceae bacterium]|nr:primosomal protein N' [Paracoccaceae bacterium]
MQDIDFFHAGELVSVLTTQPIDRPLDYKAPEGGCFRGAFVEVPLGPRKVLGVVWGPGHGGYDINKIRSVIRVLDVAPMRDELRLFLEKAADYTITPMNAMLRLATRAPGLMDPPAMRKIYVRGAVPEGAKLTDARKRVLDILDEYGGAPFTLRELSDMAGVTSSVIKGLVKLGAVLEQNTPRDAPFARMDPDARGKDLTEAQANAARALSEMVARDDYATALLRGVTGSGKTEVYLEAVAATLAKGQQVLVLLPEIALTAEFLTRVQARFGVLPAEWHSGVTMTDRRRIWKMVGQGGAQVVIGARSALFLPFQNLGLIVVDEEHDKSYKQTDGVMYNARDMAVLRASLSGAKVVLASATPSLETWVNAQAGKYDLVELDDRFGVSVMPDMHTIDMRGEKLPSGRWVSDHLVQLINQRIARGEQAMLFINRRGYAPITLCRACGQQIGCDACDARMVEHRFLNRLMCHQCGETKPVPTQCPHCAAEDRLAPVADIIIGTQLVAKGHNFPLLTLVGVIDADLGLQGSDLRAAEHTFQLMRQVAGRAGRAEKRGAAYLQTYQPDHPVIRAILAGDEDGFWQAEASGRQAAGVPPFGRMAGIIISATDPEMAFQLGQHLARNDAALRQINAQVFGPAPAPIARVRGRHRVRLLIKADKAAPLQRAIAQWTKDLSLKGDLRLIIDIDPQSFL